MPSDAVNKADSYWAQFSETIKSWYYAEDDPNYHPGVRQPTKINPNTKFTSKVIETQIALSTGSMTHAKLHLVAFNVLIKAITLNTILQKNRSLMLKSACLLIKYGFDIGLNLLLAKETFKNTFTPETHNIEIEAWIALGAIEFIYLCGIIYAHCTEENGAVDQETPQNIVAETPTASTTLLSKTEKTTPTCFDIKNFINEIQLPFKFYTGVMMFFYGIMFCEKWDWKAQLPASTVFYGLMMAIAQITCDLLKGDKINWALAKYALACGMSEGITYYSCLRWMPEDWHTGVKALTVAASTNLAIFVPGNVIDALSDKKPKPSNNTAINDTSSDETAIDMQPK